VAKVRVRGFTVVRDALGSSVVEVEVDHPETVKGTLEALLKKYGPLREVIVDPATGEMAPFLLVLNNEVISSTIDMDRPVQSGDEIVIIFPIGGG
jgi:MoaD family protein